MCSAVAWNGRWQEALTLLDEMRSEGVAPDQFAFGAAVNACAKGGQWERAVALLDKVIPWETTCLYLARRANVRAIVASRFKQRSVGCFS